MENKLKKVLVCVEDLNLDDHVIEYTHMIARTVGLKSVYLLHVIHDIPYEEEMSKQSGIDGLHSMELDKKYQKEIQRLTTGYRSAMKQAAIKHFGGIEGIEQHVEVIVGNQLKDTLTIAHEKDIDLIVMGRHLGSRLEQGDTALLPRRIARKATCSVLTIPETFVPKLSKILCPVRDSNCSALALQTAIDLAAAFKTEVHAVNLFHIYKDMHYPGGAPNPDLPKEVKLESAKVHAKEENASLAQKVSSENVKLTFYCRIDEAFRPADVYEELVEAMDCDLVVIGARGRTGAAGVLLGTITEQLIKQCKVPLWATKTKGEHIGVLKAMLTLFGK